MSNHLQTVRQLVARAYQLRKAKEQYHAWGYVYLFKGEWAGWSADFPDPSRWCPGVIAVSPGGAVYLLVGGNVNDGANDLFLLHPGTDSEGFTGNSMCSPAP